MECIMANYQRDESGRLIQHVNEPKQLVSASLTPTAIAGLDALALHYGVKGRSAFLEQLGRGTLQVNAQIASPQLHNSVCDDREAV